MVRLAQRTLAQPSRVLWVAAALMALAGWLCTGLVLDNDPRKLAPVDADRDAANAHHEALFGADDTLLLLILTDENNERLVQAVETIEAAVIQMEDVLRVQSPCSVKVPMDREGALVFTPAFGRESQLEMDSVGSFES